MGLYPALISSPKQLEGKKRAHSLVHACMRAGGASVGASSHLQPYVCPMCMYYTSVCVFVCMYLWWYMHRQTPTQLLTPFPTFTENRMRRLMGRDKHKDMA